MLVTVEGRALEVLGFKTCGPSLQQGSARELLRFISDNTSVVLLTYLSLLWYPDVYFFFCPPPESIVAILMNKLIASM